MGLWVNGVLLLYAVSLLMQVVSIFTFQRQGRPVAAWCKWLNIAGSALFVLVVTVFALAFVFDRFELYQVWSHSSVELPLYFKVAAIWEGQEGSFLLWGFFQILFSSRLLFSKSLVKNYAAAILMLVQLFLLLPLIHFPWTTGSYLFGLTSDVLNVSDQTLTFRWLLEKGNGMNPLLQNFWMTIHPPVIFLAFASASVPFALVIAGLWQRDQSWNQPAQRWLKISMTTLTIGILMGAYWAYETLNFGGYWSWDPVENAVYLPWLAGVAALHLNWAAMRSARHEMTAAALNGVYFILVVYSTFLTRSGVLQSASVHAFVDGGYSGILLTFLLSMIGFLGAALLYARRTQRMRWVEPIRFENTTDWLLIVATVLLLAAFQVFVNTSTPVLNSLLNTVGIESDLAPAAGVTGYSVGQGIFALILLLALLVTEFGEGQLRLRWLVVSLFAAALIVVKVQQMVSLPYSLGMALLALSGVLLFILIRKGLRSLRISGLGGSQLTHTGFALLLAGVVLSNQLHHRLRPEESHVLLTQNVSQEINGNRYHWDGRFVKDDRGQLINTRHLKQSLRTDRYISKDIILVTGVAYKPGDVVKVNTFETYFSIRDKEGERYFSNTYVEDTDTYFVTPTISHSLFADMYLHISNFRDNSRIVWHDSAGFYFKEGHTTSNSLKLRSVLELPSLPGMYLNSNRKAYMVNLEWNDGSRACLLSPIVIVEGGRQVLSLNDVVTDCGVGADVREWYNERDFSVNVSRADADWITIRVEEKPLINLFWLGGMLIAIGIAVSVKTNHPHKTGNKHHYTSNSKQPVIRDRLSKQRSYDKV